MYQIANDMVTERKQPMHVNMMKTFLPVVMMYTVCMSLQAAMRVDMRCTAGRYIAAGVELVGAADGGAPTEWDTTQEPDGWMQITSGSATADVLVLNTTAAVVGGRLVADETWDDERVVVVRDDIVVPSGMTLTLGAGCIVKFTDGARIVVENGGAVVAEGAYFAAFDDDSVGGDTDMNGLRAEGGNLYHGWLDDPAVAALSTVRFVDGSTNLPTRTYSAGVAYGVLPELVRDDAMFGGWFTENGGLGQAALPENLVAVGETVLYAYWIPYELSIDSSSVTVAADASEGSFSVTANSAWEVSCDAGWVTVQGGRGAYPYAAAVTYAVSENAKTEARTATIRVTMQSAGDNMPYQCDFTITQSGMATLAAPTINPTDGATFSGSSRRVSISGAEDGAEIRYTLDGSEPTATSKLYTKSFNVFDTTVVKVKAFKAGRLASATVSSRIVRLQTLAEALDVPLWTVATDGDALWTVDESAGRNGSSCARSGLIGDNQECELSTTVDGAGTLTFWWKVDCEDDPDYDNWDYLMFEVDGTEISRIDGNSDWRKVSVKIKAEGRHDVAWRYSKDYTDDDMTGIADCGWVDQVVWTPLAGESEVPVAWLEGLGVVSSGMSAADAANADPDGDGLTTAQEYIAGTDPNDPDSAFTASIEIVDGTPVVTYSPDLLSERKYQTFGRKSLSDPDEKWTPLESGQESDYNFFKVEVEMP